jgi:hypothetical protein
MFCWKYVLEPDAMRKLTLSMEPDVIAAAKRLAKEQKTSVSNMIRQYIKAMDRQDWKSMPIGPRTRRISGIISLPPDKTYRELVEEALEEKYGKL